MNLTSFLLQVPVIEQVTEPSEIRMSLWDMAVQGGWIMLILAVFSVIAFYIFIERFITINKAAKKDDMFMETIRSYMKDGKLNDAKVLCQKASTPLSRMIEKGISRIGKPLNDIQTAVENVYYIKAEGNYVNVFYNNKGGISSFVLRNKIQAIEDAFAGTPLIRCHRTYIVNSNNIKLIRNEADGYYIDFNQTGLESVPVSNTYREKIVKRFTEIWFFSKFL